MLGVNDMHMCLQLLILILNSLQVSDLACLKSGTSTALKSRFSQEFVQTKATVKRRVDTEFKVVNNDTNMTQTFLKSSKVAVTSSFGTASRTPGLVGPSRIIYLYLYKS